MRKIILVIVILSLLLASCNHESSNPSSQATGFIPGKSSLPEKQGSDKNYYLVEVSKDVLSPPIITKPSTTTVWDETATPVEITSAKLTTDKNGVAVVADSKAGGFVPVIVLDENQKPIEGMSISYECSSDRVILAIYDPNGKYDPQIITVNVADLHAGIGRGDGSYSVGEMASLMFPVSAIPTLSPGKELLLNGVIAVLPFAAKVWGVVGVIKNAVTFGFSLPQLVGASQGQPYVCIPPGFWSSPLIQAADIAIAFIAPEEKGIEIVAAKFITAYLVSRGIESVFDRPVLFKVLTFDQSTMDMIIHDAGHVSNAIKILSATFQPVGPNIGKCVFVPDLSQLKVTEARKTLADMGIQPKDYDVVCPNGDAACEDGNVYSQTPVPNTEVTPLPLMTIPIPSCLAIFTNGDVQPRMSVNIYYMVLEPSEPLPPSETEPPIQSPPSMNLIGQIAFDSNRSGTFEIYVLDAKTRQITQLTFMSSPRGDPNWSPDGKTLAYDSTIDKSSLTRGVYVMTVFPQLGTPQLINADRAWAPKWSPDGKHIAYISDRSNTVLGSRIFIMNADGSNDRYLSPSNVYGYEGDITWSPDSSQIYFTAVAMGQGQIFSNFCVTKADAYNPICPPANFSKDVSNLDWSPDGKEAVFTMQADIHRINSDGTGLTKLTETGKESNPTWSPDGKYIAFVSNRDGNNEIYVMDAEGNNETNMTNNPSNDAFPDWSTAPSPELEPTTRTYPSSQVYCGNRYWPIVLNAKWVYSGTRNKSQEGGTPAGNNTVITETVTETWQITQIDGIYPYPANFTVSINDSGSTNYYCDETGIYRFYQNQKVKELPPENEIIPGKTYNVGFGAIINIGQFNSINTPLGNIQAIMIQSGVWRDLPPPYYDYALDIGVISFERFGMEGVWGATLTDYFIPGYTKQEP